ncbi:MAG: leader peptide processing enzyme [Spirochaetales bacterium]|nr:leader peptide processing enzyme [Spirochaetales bacterium]
MNKKVNTVLFIMAATVVNIVTMLIILFAGIYLAGALLSESARESAGQFVFIVIFLIAVLGSFFIYNRLVRAVSKRIDFEKHFHPIFKPRGGPRRRDANPED